MVKNLSANAGDIRDAGLSLGREDPLEEGMATHSSVLAWRILWTEETGGLWLMGSQRGGHDWRDLAQLSTIYSQPGMRTQCLSCLPVCG